MTHPMFLTREARRELLFEWWANRKAITAIHHAELPSYPALTLRIKNHHIEELLGYRKPDFREPEINGTVHCCPDCETPNQFGELCIQCQRERHAEGDAQSYNDLEQ